MYIGKNIKQLRQEKGITQDKLAEHLGISYQAISKWENDANTPDIGLLPEIASFFQVSIDALFAENMTAQVTNTDILKDDGVMRVVQMQGRQILKASPAGTPIELVLPQNSRVQLEVYGNLETESDIYGDVTCQGSVRCGDINGAVSVEENLNCGDINGPVACQGGLTCDDISGAVASQTVKCDDIFGGVNCNTLSAGDIDTKGGDLICNRIESCGTVMCRELKCDHVVCDEIL